MIYADDVVREFKAAAAKDWLPNTKDLSRKYNCRPVDVLDATSIAVEEGALPAKCEEWLEAAHSDVLYTHDIHNRERHHVYFIRAKGTEAVKIGRAKYPKRRVALLQVGNHMELELLGYFGVEAARAEQAEREMHNLFAAQKIRGEWFDNPDISKVVEWAEKWPFYTNLKNLGVRS